MPAIKLHHTDTADSDWDAGANLKRLGAEPGAAKLRLMHAWIEPNADPELKRAYKLPHHMISASGEVGAANLKACASAIGALNGARGGVMIPDADRKPVHRHLAAHMMDADMEPPALKEAPDDTRAEKQIEVKLRELTDKGEFIGFASFFGNVDLGGDVIHKGAFLRCIGEKDGRVPLLQAHHLPVGVAYIRETDDGLETRGILNLDKQTARDVYSDLKFYREHEMPMGMSIGYDSIPDKTNLKSGVRHLSEVILHEVSLTEFPMNPEARVRAVKEQKAAFAEALRERRIWDKRSQMLITLDRALDNLLSDSSLADEEITAESEASIGEFHQEYMGWLPEMLVLMARHKDGADHYERKRVEVFTINEARASLGFDPIEDGDQRFLEIKAGRKLSADSRAAVERSHQAMERAMAVADDVMNKLGEKTMGAEMISGMMAQMIGHMRRATQSLQGLLAGESDEKSDATSAPETRSPQPGPEVDLHLALRSLSQKAKEILSHGP